MGLFARNHSIGETGLLKGFTDCHCHILPGVDDGVRTMEDSLAILDRYAGLGIQEVWLTPHIMEDVPNTTAALKERFQELCARYQGNIKLHLAAEYMLDGLFESRLEARDLLTHGSNGEYLLVETSYFNAPSRLASILQDVMNSGYFPILAHPERYMYMLKDDYKTLRDRGVKMQLNLPSLMGNYGTSVQKKAFELLKEGYYDIAGTDLHRMRQLDTMFTTRCLPRKVYKLLKPELFINI